MKHAELTPAQTWRLKSDGNFGGRSLLTPDPDTLAHYGVPGMRWGIKTQEYVKKGYNTLKRRQAIQKMKRKAEAKAQYDDGYNRGQRVASNTYFIKKKVAAVLEKKEAKTNPKQSLTDRAVDKGADFLLKKSGLDEIAKAYGLDAHLETAKNFLKDQKNKGIDGIYDWLKDGDNQQKAQDILNRILTGRIVGGGLRRLGQAGSDLIDRAPDVRRAIGRGAVSAAKAALRGIRSGARSGARWIRDGGYDRIRNAINTAGNAANSAGNRILRGAYNVADQLNRSANYAHRHARRGHDALHRMLSRRPGRS